LDVRYLLGVNWGTIIYVAVAVLFALNVAVLYWVGQLLVM